MKLGKLIGSWPLLHQLDGDPLGLGKAARAETVEVKWPSGLQQTFPNVDADKFYLIQEGSERLEIQTFARHPSTAR